MLISDYLLAGAWGQRRDTRDKKDKSKRASQPFGKNPPLMIMSVCGKYLQGNYRIQAVKAQCEIRALEKQLLLAHMRADLETEESVSSSL